MRVTDYTIGWICALPIELAAAQAMLDEEHENITRDGLYTLGSINSHHIVIASLPAGQTGTQSAAAVAARMTSRFPAIQFGLMVGIGGGVPSTESDVRLGDVVVSQPHLQHGGVVQWDFGKIGTDGQETRTGSLNALPPILLYAISKQRALQYRGQTNLMAHLSVFDRLESQTFSRAGAGPDVLFEAPYNHVGGTSCVLCDQQRHVIRTARTGQDVVVHYGTIASGNRVIKDGITRDKISAQLGGVLCFEMEAAGLMNEFPCLVIRGICDYADSHKNKAWQAVAASTAAAYAKEILCIIPANKEQGTDALSTGALRMGNDQLTTSLGPTLERIPAPPVERLSVEEASIQVLDMLKFRQMYAREESVQKAFPETFQWALRDESLGLTPLASWIRGEGSGCYWVSGKAGSGKSTLMKFLRSSSEVQNLIKRPNRLITASFYFWRSGTVLQRSQEGLLRWLLYTILSQEPGLIDLCFPETIRRIQDSHQAEFQDDVQNLGAEDQQDHHAWSEYEVAFDEKGTETKQIPFPDLVKQAFRRLSTLDLPDWKIFLFIDGIDEFAGNHTEISLFFTALSASPNIKILLSSRPIRACVEVFKPCPSLRLQDLTQKDMRTYLEGTIGIHPAMKLSALENGMEASQLIDSILSKASGVFLWIHLVVKSLLEGLGNYDRISELLQRIDELPSELSELYMHMFHAMGKRYQSNAAELIRMVARGTEVQQNGAITLLQLSFADNINPKLVLNSPAGPISPAEMQARFEALEARIQTRCCELVEVVHTNGSQSIVRVLHASVMDFIAEQEVSDILISRSPNLDPDKVLSLASLLAIKKSPLYPNPLYQEGAVANFLVYLQAYEQSIGRAQIELLHELIHLRHEWIERNDEVQKRERKPIPIKLGGSFIYHCNSPWIPAVARMSLARQITRIGLFHSIDFILESSAKWSDILHDFDLPSLSLWIVEDIVSAFLKGNTFQLAESYTHILRSFLRHISKTLGPYSTTMAWLWRNATGSLAKLERESTYWIESEDRLQILKSLLTVIDILVEYSGLFNRDICAIPIDDWTTPYTGTESRLSNLLSWLKYEASRLNRRSSDDSTILAQIEQLHNKITDVLRETFGPHNQNLKSSDWARWFEERIIHSLLSSPTRVEPSLGRQNAKIVPGGPFELDSQCIGPVQLQVPTQSLGDLQHPKRQRHLLQPTSSTSSSLAYSQSASPVPFQDNTSRRRDKKSPERKSRWRKLFKM